LSLEVVFLPLQQPFLSLLQDFFLPSTDNERSTVVVKHKNGQEILFRQIAGAVARRIVCYAEEGESVEQGEEIGFIKFGSRVDVFLSSYCGSNTRPEQYCSI